MISASSDQTESDLIRMLRHRLRDLPEVQAVLLGKDGFKEAVLTLVSVNDNSARDRVYSQLEAIRQVFPGIDFDFRVSLITAGSVPEPLAGWVVVFNRANPMEQW